MTALSGPLDELSSSRELVLDKAITYKAEGVLGCKHYPRKCKLLAACCQQLYTCRLCHDDKVVDHKIDRYATQQVFCMVCETLQPVAEKCEKCAVVFAVYFCHICKFYDDTPNKEIYHCKECGLCRLGSAETTFHCQECGVCMPTHNREHKHIANNLKDNCPICNEDMFSSRDPAHYLPCGHSLHYTCFEDLYKNGGYGCPKCKKSIADFSSLWIRHDVAIRSRPMPAIFANAKLLVLCNDCDQKSESPYHYFGARCQPCGSYNTAIIGRSNFPTQDEIIAWDAAERAQELQAQQQLQEEQPAADSQPAPALSYDFDDMMLDFERQLAGDSVDDLVFDEESDEESSEAESGPDEPSVRPEAAD